MRTLIALLSVGLIVGCTPTMQSRAVIDYSGTPKRIIIVATEGQISLGAEWRSFETRLEGGLRACGISTETRDVQRAPAADLMRRIHDGEVGRDLDAVLRIQPVGVNATLIGGRSIPNDVEYETLVVERSSGRALFRGRIDISLGVPFRAAGWAGNRAATTLIRQLSKDNIVRTCGAA